MIYIIIIIILYIILCRHEQREYSSTSKSTQRLEENGLSRAYHGKYHSVTIFSFN